MLKKKIVIHMRKNPCNFGSLNSHLHTSCYNGSLLVISAIKTQIKEVSLPQDIRSGTVANTAPYSFHFGSGKKNRQPTLLKILYQFREGVTAVIPNNLNVPFSFPFAHSLLLTLAHIFHPNRYF